MPYEVEESKKDSNIISNINTNTPRLSFPAAKAGDSADKIFKYLETYARTNNVAFIAPGTQLTFLTIYQSGTVNVNTGKEIITVPTSGFLLNRIYIPNGDSGSDNAWAINGEWKVLSDISQGAFSVALTNANGDHITIECGDAESEKGMLKITVEPKEITYNENNCGMACILSRYVNGVWKRNTARLVIDSDLLVPYSFEDWLSTYQTTGAASKKYLNNGDEGTGLQG